jgi:hypothetical protein
MTSKNIPWNRSSHGNCDITNNIFYEQEIVLIKNYLEETNLASQSESHVAKNGISTDYKRFKVVDSTFLLGSWQQEIGNIQD